MGPMTPTPGHSGAFHRATGLTLLTGLACLSMLLSGCNEAGTEPAPEAPKPLVFAIDSIPQGLTLDSLWAIVRVGVDGKPDTFEVNLQTGRSTAKTQAKPGELVVIEYELFSGGLSIGRGSQSAIAGQQGGIAIAPVWLEENIAKLRQNQSGPSLFPDNLDASYRYARSGTLFELSLDSLDGVTYSWKIAHGDILLTSGQNRTISWNPRDDEVGKSIRLEIEAVRTGAPDEKKSWTIDVLSQSAAISKRIAFITLDLGSNQGTYTRYTYEGETGPLQSIEVFESLSPSPGAKPTVSYTLSYELGRKVGVRVQANGQAARDSAYTYDETGKLLKASVPQEESYDTLLYSGADLVESRRYSRGSMIARIRHLRLGGRPVEDTLFQVREDGEHPIRLIRYNYRSERLERKLEMIWADGANGPQPFRLERFQYNGLGQMLKHDLYEDAFAPILIESESFEYSAEGLLNKTAKVTGEGDTLYRKEYHYSPSGSLTKVSAGSAQSISAGGGSTQAADYQLVSALFSRLKEAAYSSKSSYSSPSPAHSQTHKDKP